MSKPNGRPPLYSEDVVVTICERLSNGTPLREICRTEGMPHWTTVYSWMAKDEALSIRIAHAREVGHDAIAEEALEISNTPLSGVIKTTKGDGSIEERVEDMLGHRKLQIETRLKLLAKWNPKRYGDKVENTHKGDPTAPIALILNGSDVNG